MSDDENHTARLFRRLLACRMLPDPTWISDDEMVAYVWLHKQADTISCVLSLLDDPSSGVVAGFPHDDGTPRVTRRAQDDLRPIDRDPARQARARAVLVAQRAGYEQQIAQMERGEITADFPDDADAPTFRPADVGGEGKAER
jgi:hypothetical protein